MQNRKAVVIPMGMLLKVNLNVVIFGMTVKAKNENPAFDISKVMDQAIDLSDQFNKAQISKEDFPRNICSLFGITKMSVDQFWELWNSALTLDGAADNIKMLQRLSENNNVIFYPISDSNAVHLDLIVKADKKYGIDLIINGREATLNGMPLYVTCLLGTNRQGVNEKAVNAIREKEFNRVSDIIVLMGDPANLPIPLQQRAKKEVESITKCSNENGAKVELLSNANNNTLEKTLYRVLGIELTQELKPAFGM